MKTTAAMLMRDQKGGAFILTLVLLLVGALIVPSLLGFMFGGSVQAEVYERRGAELYAADAGVEDALWRIQRGKVTFCPAAPPRSYPMEDLINGKEVSFEIYSGYDAKGVSYYRIISTATGDGSGTVIEAYATSVYGNYTDITNNVLTSRQGIGYPPSYGLVYPDGHGPVEDYDGFWPTPDDDGNNPLAAWYWEDVKDGQEHSGDLPVNWEDVEDGLKHSGDLTIDLDGSDLQLPGSLYVDGTLTITDKKKNTNSRLTLGGTIYTTGDIRINNADITVDLNGHAIFTESDTVKPDGYAFYVSTTAPEGNPVYVQGPGVIAAIGDIYFEPNMDSDQGSPVFIISVEGKTHLKPNGDFYGAIAGGAEIELQSGASVTYPEDGFPEDLNWPGFASKKVRYVLYSWTVSTF